MEENEQFITEIHNNRKIGNEKKYIYVCVYFI